MTPQELLAALGLTIEEQTTTIAGLQASLESAQAQIAQANADRDAAGAAAAAATSTLQDYQARVHELEIAPRDAQIAALQQQLSDLNARIDAAQAGA